MSQDSAGLDPLREQELTLTSGKLQLSVSPWGASLRGLVSLGVGAPREIITRYQGTGKVGGQGDVLIPFPGRVADGRYRFDGVEHQMHRNDAEGPNAIHGFLRMRPWNTLRQSEDAVAFAVDLAHDDVEGYPFDLHVEVEYLLTPNGLSTSFGITNTGQNAAPVGAGFHPYFRVSPGLIDDCLLKLPFQSYLEYNEHLVPTGAILPVSGSSFDFSTFRPIGQTVFNTCFMAAVPDKDGVTRIGLAGPDNSHAVSVWLSEDIGYVVLYSGDPLPESHRRRALAIEPMSCGTDAFNHPQWGLRSVAPGITTTGSWGVTIDG